MTRHISPWDEPSVGARGGGWAQPGPRQGWNWDQPSSWEGVKTQSRSSWGSCRPAAGVMVAGSSRAQRGARPDLSVLGQVRTRYLQGINNALPAQGCRHLHSLFSGQYSNAFLRRGHGDISATSDPDPFPRQPPYSLSPGCGGPADQSGLTRADLVDAEGQTPGGDVATLGQRQPPLAHSLAVLPCAAAARAAILVPLAPGSWWGEKRG